MRAISKRGKIAEKSAGVHVFGDALAAYRCCISIRMHAAALDRSRLSSDVPLHIMVTQAFVRTALLGPDELLELIRSCTKKTNVLFPTMSWLPSEGERLFGDTEKVKRELEGVERDHATWNTDREGKDLAQILGTVRGLAFGVSTLMADCISLGRRRRHDGIRSDLNFPWFWEKCLLSG
jgi:hypothetical protein